MIPVGEGERIHMLNTSCKLDFETIICGGLWCPICRQTPPGNFLEDPMDLYDSRRALPMPLDTIDLVWWTFFTKQSKKLPAKGKKKPLEWSNFKIGVGDFAEIFSYFEFVNIQDTNMPLSFNYQCALCRL